MIHITLLYKQYAFDRTIRFAFSAAPSCCTWMSTGVLYVCMYMYPFSKMKTLLTLLCETFIFFRSAHVFYGNLFFTLFLLTPEAVLCGGRVRKVLPYVS